MHPTRALTAGPVERAVAVRPAPYTVKAISGQEHPPSTDTSQQPSSMSTGSHLAPQLQDGVFPAAPFHGDVALADSTSSSLSDGSAHEDAMPDESASPHLFQQNLQHKQRVSF
eukprot:1079796-Karenia_brevis.AAC.1